MLNSYTAKVGDKFTINGSVYEVVTVLPAGSWGKSHASGPTVLGREFIAEGVAPMGRGVSVDATTTNIEWNE